ncbi:hypothetical protein TKK_0006244 [Trichogramma kaykai]|uniref:Pacifastin domain-containing protein n=1 Tax=Trichogramma kaykai TaxID=54128 RepID=A0ABD2XE16_9HYME
MKSFIVLSVLVTLAAGQTCPRGTSYEDNCNKCTCNPITGAVACSLGGCAAANSDIEDVHFQKKLLNFDPTKHCPRGVEYKDGCGHTCRCSSINGNTNCPPGFCDKPDPPIEDKPEGRSPWSELTVSAIPTRVTGEPCAPNTYFPTEYKTWCLCQMDTNLLKCDLKEPPTQEFLDAAYKAYQMKQGSTTTFRPVEQLTTTTTTSAPIFFEDTLAEKCPKGIAYEEDCNHCHCDPYSGKALCHQIPSCIASLIHVRQKPVDPPTQTFAKLETDPNNTRVCTPNSRFYRDCNVCVCSDTGFFFSCSDKVCETKN